MRTVVSYLGCVCHVGAIRWCLRPRARSHFWYRKRAFELSPRHCYAPVWLSFDFIRNLILFQRTRSSRAKGPRSTRGGTHFTFACAPYTFTASCPLREMLKNICRGIGPLISLFAFLTLGNHWELHILVLRCCCIYEDMRKYTCVTTTKTASVCCVLQGIIMTGGIALTFVPSFFLCLLRDRCVACEARAPPSPQSDVFTILFAANHWTTRVGRFWR